MADISPKPSNTVEGSINPVESNIHPGGVPTSFGDPEKGTITGGENILDSPPSQHAAYALGKVPD